MSIETQTSEARWAPPAWMNRIMTIMLRTPGLQRLLGKSTALITFKGRKSGRMITTPVSYMRVGDRILTTGHTSRQWWRNLIAEPNLTIRLQGKDHEAIATVERGDKALEDFVAYLEAQPMVAKVSNVELDAEGRANTEQAAAALTETVMVSLVLED